MPYYRLIGDTSLSQLFTATAQTAGSVGLFLIFRKNDEPISASRRLPAFVTAIGLACLVSALYFYMADLPVAPASIFVGHAAELFRFETRSLIAFAYLGTIALVLYRNRKERPQALLTMIQSLVFFTVADLQFLLSANQYDSDMLIAHLYKLAGIYFLMKGIYYVTIEEPYQQYKRTESRINFLAFSRRADRVVQPPPVEGAAERRAAARAPERRPGRGVPPRYRPVQNH